MSDKNSAAKAKNEALSDSESHSHSGSASHSDSESGSGSDTGSNSGSSSGSVSGSVSSQSGSGSDSNDSASESGAETANKGNVSPSKRVVTGKKRAQAKKKLGNGDEKPRRKKAPNGMRKSKGEKSAMDVEAAEDDEIVQVKKLKKKLILEEEEDEDLEGLTEVEKEKRLLEKYEADEKRRKEKELRKRLIAAQGGDQSEEGEDSEDDVISDFIPSRRKNKESDQRKQALSNLKANKAKDQTRSMLRDRLGNEYDSDYSDTEKSSRALTEKRRKRQDLLVRRGGDDDDASYSDESEGQKRSRRKSQPKARVDRDISVPIPLDLLQSNMDPKLERPEDVLPADWSQANYYLLKRRAFFEKYFFEPYFDALVRGVYVRIPIGEKEGETVYRFCEIVSLSKLPRPYKFAGEMTNKGITCAFGKSKIDWRLNAVSSHSLQESEFLLWRATLNKDRLKFPTCGEVRKIFSDKNQLISKYRYTEQEVSEMVQRKGMAGIGIAQVPLGVQRVRLERDIKAAREMKNFDKAIALEAKLQRLLIENEARQSKKSDDVLRITEINRRNREANRKQDLQAQELNDAMRDKMTSAERLQFIRASSKKMFLSRDKIEANLAQGKLIKLSDGRIMTLNKAHEIEALPDDLITKEVANNPLESEVDGGSGKIEIDVEKLLAKQRERKQKEKLDKESRSDDAKDTKVEYIGAAPANVTEIANTTIRIQDDDGSWTTLRPANEIVKEMREKQKVSTEAKAMRKGITVKEYFDRVKKQRIDAEDTDM